MKAQHTNRIYSLTHPFLCRRPSRSLTMSTLTILRVCLPVPVLVPLSPACVNVTALL